MEIMEIKDVLHNMIEHADESQLCELYELMRNYFNGNADDKWNEKTEPQKVMILQGVSEAEQGLITPLSHINKRLRAKYGLND